MTQDTPHLERSLGPLMIWGLGVGYVISGEYFGWNLGLEQGGPYGMLVATLLVTALYVCFTLSYAELACALPGAGGAYVYSARALGERAGFLAGVAQLIEFCFAPPAIALAIGGYLQTYSPNTPAVALAVGAYLSFTALNAYGVRASAVFELVMTAFAVGELLLFAGVALPSVEWANFHRNPLPNGWWGVLPALPFAIWFYLAIEGVANIAEEARDPQRDISRGFIYALGTLVALTLLVFVSSVGVAGWEALVYPNPADPARVTSDSPLPLALARVVGGDHPLYHLLVTVGLFGLVASFHGIILVAGRAAMALGRVGYLPAAVGRVHPTRKTPVAALALNMCVGLAALATGKTGEIITLSVFGALTLYALSSLSLLRLRAREPELARPYRAPLYPLLPLVALALSLLCLGALAVYHAAVGGVYLAIVAGAFGLKELLGVRARPA